jgi:hypothetical protein
VAIGRPSTKAVSKAECVTLKPPSFFILINPL